MAQEIREMVNGALMTGVAHAGPDMERAFVRHEMPDGSFAVEEVFRSVGAAPAAAPEATAPEPEPSAPETTTDAA